MAHAAPLKKQTLKPAKNVEMALDLPTLRPLAVIDSDFPALGPNSASFLNIVIDAVRTKNYDAAIQATQTQINNHPKDAALLNLCAALYLYQDDADAAEKYLLQAARANPTDQKIINNRACIHLLRGNTQVAIDSLRAGARGATVNFAEYDYNWALGLHAQDQFDAASLHLTRALSKNPLPDIYILQARQAFLSFGADESLKIMRSAYQKYPNHLDVRYYLAAFLSSLNKTDEAMPLITLNVLEHPERVYDLMLFAVAMRHVIFDRYNPDYARAFVHALSSPHIKPVYLDNPWQTAFYHMPIWADAIQKGTDLQPHDIDPLVRDLKKISSLAAPFILAGLGQMILRAHYCEWLFSQMRAYYLDTIYNGTRSLDADDLAFLSALASQCYHNEYVYYVTDIERAQIHAMIKTPPSRTTDPAKLLILCCYQSLAHILPDDDCQTLADHPLFAQIVLEQVTGPARDHEIMHTLPSLTPIHDSTSKAVEAMYLENPYPAWLRVNHSGDHRYLRLAPNKKDRIQVLVAGCGTGQHAISVATGYRNVHVTAIDLSKRSLAYAARKTQDMGLANIDYAQADILELGNWEARFDMIESAGVLHHLADPLRGLDILLGLLKPGGVMLLGLYSEHARQAIVVGRADIETRGLTPTPDDIRRFRFDVLQCPNTDPLAGLKRKGDFYTLSTCRDLVFHVQETRYTLPQIKKILADRHLAFLGFNLDYTKQKEFLRRHPDPKDHLNLDLWDQYEQEFPETFASMYQFRIQKPF